MAIIKRKSKRKKTRYAVKVSRSGGVQEWLGTFDTLKEAKEAERKALSRPGGYRKETCQSFARRWVRDYPRPRASTNATNANAVRKFSDEARFASLKLDDLDRRTAREWVMENPSQHAALRAMFNDAVRDELCHSNPFADLRLPQSRGRKDLVPITSEEFDRLCDCALEVHGNYGKNFEALILAAAYTLMRPGELFVLEWSDVDFENNEITVSKTLSGDNTIELPKNGRVRTITLPPVVKLALLQMEHIEGTDRVFSSISGRRFAKSSFHYAWTPVRTRFGKPDMDFYELKHFGCTYWLDERGLSPADVALQCGHTDGGALIMSTYGHPSEKKARDRIKRAWSEADSTDARLKLVE
ncbi:MAG: site-specific integrase [Solirubrobacterales bacterium]|nr:site-specific integrase [Solirubrobacterales bacterium]